MKACTVKPPGPAELTIIFCGSYPTVFQKPSQNAANSFPGYYKNGINSHIYDHQSEAIYKQLFSQPVTSLHPRLECH